MIINSAAWAPNLVAVVCVGHHSRFTPLPDIHCVLIRALSLVWGVHVSISGTLDYCGSTNPGTEAAGEGFWCHTCLRTLFCWEEVCIPKPPRPHAPSARRTAGMSSACWWRDSSLLSKRGDGGFSPDVQSGLRGVCGFPGWPFLGTAGSEIQAGARWGCIRCPWLGSPQSQAVDGSGIVRYRGRGLGSRRQTVSPNPTVPLAGRMYPMNGSKWVKPSLT